MICNGRISFGYTKEKYLLFTYQSVWTAKRRRRIEDNNEQTAGDCQ
jgi:hypothetical protein